MYNDRRGETTAHNKKVCIKNVKCFMRERCNAQNVKRIMQGEETYNERSVYGMTCKKGAHTQIPPTPPFRF